MHLLTAGAPPPAAVLERVERLGIEVLQVYGLTETTGHVVHCAWEAPGTRCRTASARR